MDEEQHILHGPPYFEKVSEKSAGQQLYESLVQNQDLPGIVDPISGKTETFKEILHTSCRLANALRNRGFSKRNVIGIFSENSILFCKPLLAGFFLGCPVTTFNPAYTQDEMLHMVNISKPSVIFCTKATLRLVLQLKKQLEYLSEIVILNSVDNVNGVFSLENYISKETCSAFTPVEVDPYNDVALIMYSSGTTGLPKGVMITHSGFSTNLAIYRDERYYKRIRTHQETHIIIAPMFHLYGLAFSLRCLAFGYRAIIFEKFDEKLYLETIQRYKVSKLYIVPSLAGVLAHSSLLDHYDLSSIEYVMSAGASLNPEAVKILKTRLVGLQHIQEIYGMTETLTLTNFRFNDSRTGSCGKIVPGHAGKVINSEGKTLGPFSSGEMCFKGNAIMKGYMGDPKSTRQIIDEQGWLATGDLGYYDNEGYFYVVDRLKELIKYKSYQVPPAELEAVLATHPKILEAAVIGIPHEQHGELPCAFVVKKMGCDISETEVQNFVIERVSPQKWLRGGVKFVNELPKTPSGKIMKRKLRELIHNKSKL